MQKTYSEFKSLFPDSTRFYCSYQQNANYKNNEIIFTYNKNKNKEKYIYDLLIEYPSHQYAHIELEQEARYIIYTNKKFGMIFKILPIFTIININEIMMQEIITMEMDRYVAKLKQSYSSWEREPYVCFDFADNCYFTQLLNDPKIKTFNLCKNVVVSYFFLIKYVPPEFLNDDFFVYCHDKMHDDIYHFMLRLLIEDKKISLPICNAIVSDVYSYYNYQTNLFELIPKSFLTEDFLINSIEKANKIKSQKEFQDFIYKITDYLTNQNLLTEKIKFCINIFVPKNTKKEKTQYEYFEEIKKRPNDICYVPNEVVTIDMCNYVLSSGEFDNFEKFPNHVLELNENIILSCIKKYKYNDTSSYLSYIPVIFKTEKVCRLAIKYNSLNFEHVPATLKNKELCDFAYDTSKFWKKKYIYNAFPPDVKIIYDNKIASSNCSTM